MSRRWINRIVGVAVLLAGSPIVAPELLAFPYSAQVRGHRVYSDTPIDPALGKIVAAADAEVARSPIASARPSDQPIFLTDGGWRWTLLALQYRSTFALTRPVREAIIVNRSDVARDVVQPTPQSRFRNLRGTLAHEMTHGLIRAHFGLASEVRYPAELREGYCDYVGGGGTLSDAEAHALIASGQDAPALMYWRGRKKVEAALAANHGNVDALFADWRG